MSNDKQLTIIENAALRALVTSMGKDGVLLTRNVRVDPEDATRITFTAEIPESGFDATFKFDDAGIVDGLYAFAIYNDKAVVKLTEETYQGHVESMQRTSVETPLTYRATC